MRTTAKSGKGGIAKKRRGKFDHSIDELQTIVINKRASGPNMRPWKQYIDAFAQCAKVACPLIRIFVSMNTHESAGIPTFRPAK